MTTPTPSSIHSLNAFSYPHPWTTNSIRRSSTPSLNFAQASITHQLYILDCRGHDARDMQRTLNYLNAELKMRKVENLALQEAAKNTNTDGQGQQTGAKKKDPGARLKEMEDEDKRWEKDMGGNPRWGEGRAAHLYGK
ncbi:hypothetical protein CFE70_006257 [Pyrenophora teres f. teres 0-1]|uniref:Uncharacterized protein n=2 Tax=Pyrenophora teres f. teres TaxID=97479 RepID=E3RR88_PYRTT|nr:hypothetical protein PTT_11300 [Pyrenophora teres f. teres 0-1]KAE8827876.1 hypothetical protein HRS9139_07095 [Pyrenophora teres f. teres]KAE8829702.1 hypothetical protein HRS9122_09517 [Pyrenophora teres f. teres]KAE8830471.1 hypothetical protein PTNB85_07058 [Pyrenophora teres f. teres]KAE8857528.1 hypothetical protein PTNB29_08595 [Pyrenophora teres f. teres]